MKTRDYLIEEYTKTVCPVCFEERQRASNESDVFKDGMLVSRDRKIWMRRYCTAHGETESLYEEDAEIWHARRGWSTPTLSITPDRPDNYAAFPDGYRNGLPHSHGQHTCILLLNVLEKCNFSCPTCYASAKPGDDPTADELPTIQEILHTVRTVIAREGGKLGVLMISGGEPTIRKDLPDLLEELLALNITRILLNTNGRRIAREDSLLTVLQRHREKIEVYLQFDGLTEQAHMSLRGEALCEEKKLCVERLNSAGVYFTLVMTVAKETNESEVGDVLLYGLTFPKCAGLAIQPMFGSGRATDFDPRNRTTPTGVLRRLADQTHGKVTHDDFIPLPCSHRDCCDIGYLIQTRSGEWSSLTKLIRRDELKNWMHLVANTISFENASDAVREMLKSGVLQRVFSEQQKISAPQMAMDLFKMCGCVPGVSDLIGGLWAKYATRPSALEKMADSTFRITVKMFMDHHTLHEARIRQCCVHTGTFEDDPRRYSFCWRWLFADASDFPTRELIRPNTISVATKR